ncbi:molecular chaperone [Orrella sp. JC864]|uniref:fimbrial biogenesis chaperone n=1 Tax=Orrella sp. JC864 TaxID=3120298 RepID=UPI00300A2741
MTFLDRARRRLAGWRRWLACAPLVAGLLVPAPAWASGLQVAPISLEFASQDPAQAMWLSNTGKQPLNVQLRIFEWRQVGGDDQLAPTRDLVPSSSILSIDPGERQLVRLVRLQPQPPAQEQSYRVLVDELPSPSRNDGKGLRFLLRYSIPIFVLPPGATPRFKSGGPQPPTDPASFSVRAEQRDGNSWLVVTNHARQRLRLSELSLIDARGGRETVVGGLLGYVLAGQERQWQLPVAFNALRTGTLKAKLNDDPDEQTLSMDHASQ